MREKIDEVTRYLHSMDLKKTNLNIVEIDMMVFLLNKVRGELVKIETQTTNREEK